MEVFTLKNLLKYPKPRARKSCLEVDILKPWHWIRTDSPFHTFVLLSIPQLSCAWTTFCLCIWKM